MNDTKSGYVYGGLFIQVTFTKDDEIVSGKREAANQFNFSFNLDAITGLTIYNIQISSVTYNYNGNLSTSFDKIIKFPPS